MRRKIPSFILATIVFIWISSCSVFALILGFIIFLGQSSSIPLERDIIANKEIQEFDTEEKINYFKEIVLGSEIPSGPTGKVIKWLSSPTLSISGNTSLSDRKCLEETINDFNKISRKIKISQTSIDGDIHMELLSYDELKKVLPDNFKNNWGYFVFYYDYQTYVTYKADIYISNSNTTEQERCHLIREELTQAMGFPNDSYLYEDSIFQQDWTYTQNYSTIDEILIDALYNSTIEPGDEENEIVQKLEQYFTKKK